MPHQLEIGPNSYALRSAWSEVDGELLLRLLPCLFAPDRPAAQVRLVCLLADIPDAVLAQLTAWQLAEIMHLTDWLWTAPLTEPIIPTIAGAGGIEYAMPAAGGINMSLIEWHTAEQYLLRFFGGDHGALDYLVAAVLRPVADAGDAYDRRRPFNAYTLERDAAQVRADVDALHQLYVLWFVHGIRLHLAAEYAILRADDDTPPADTGASARLDFGREDDIDFGLIGTAYALAELRVFGDFDAVLRKDIHTVLYYLCWKKQEAARVNAAPPPYSNGG